MRAFVVAVVEAQGYACMTAEDGDFGLAALFLQPAQTLLLDITMPNNEGIETVWQMQQRRPQALGIMMSAGTRLI